MFQVGERVVCIDDSPIITVNNVPAKFGVKRGTVHIVLGSIGPGELNETVEVFKRCICIGVENTPLKWTLERLRANPLPHYDFWPPERFARLPKTDGVIREMLAKMKHSKTGGKV